MELLVSTVRYAKITVAFLSLIENSFIVFKELFTRVDMMSNVVNLISCPNRSNIKEHNK